MNRRAFFAALLAPGLFNPAANVAEQWKEGLTIRYVRTYDLLRCESRIDIFFGATKIPLAKISDREQLEGYGLLVRSEIQALGPKPRFSAAPRSPSRAPLPRAIHAPLRAWPRS
jgi:hypothetical protein